MAKRGRKVKLTKDKYLKAVKKARTLDDTEIADLLGMSRSSVFRYRNNVENEKVVEEANEWLESLNSIRFTDKVTYEMFEKLPLIIEWHDKLNKRRVSHGHLQRCLRGLYNVCIYLQTSPSNLNVDTIADLVVEMRDKGDNNEKVPHGLAYSNIRTGIRSFYQLVHDMSGESLSNLGIDASRTKGTGKQAKEKVTKEQRKSFEDNLLSSVQQRIKEYPDNFHYMDIYYEMIGITKFMYYTATRITASRTTTLFENPLNHYSEDLYYIHILDKGRRGGIEWNKILTGHGLESFKQYIMNRFKLESIEDVDKKIHTMKGPMFPFLSENYELERKIMKDTLSKSGVKTSIPNHIWRHTFAQDFLHASDWNYGLGASIGGWTDIGTMKLSYGEMSEDARKRGLRKAMGLPVEDVTYELRW